MPRNATREEDREIEMDERMAALARDVASVVLINAGAFRATIPGDRRAPSFNQTGEFTMDLFDGSTLVAQVIVRDARMGTSSNSRKVSGVLESLVETRTTRSSYPPVKE